MKQVIMLTAAIITLAAFCSCEKVVLDDEQDSLPSTGTPNSQLLIMTRADGDADANAALQQGRIYIFDANGACAQVLTTSEQQTSATAKLQAGTYSICALASDDLERYVLPSQQEAAATGVITTQSGKVVGDLLMAAMSSITLVDGETRQLNLRLDRKVFCVNSITISHVPADVTAVEVSLEPLYSSIRLNGTYPDETTSWRTALSQDDAVEGKWLAEPLQMQYPSSGLPTITVYFTRADGVRSYTYTANEAIEANHHLSIEGTYSEPLGVTLQGIITSTEWGEDKTIIFDFDEQTSTGHTDTGNNGDDNEGDDTGDDNGDDTGNNDSGNQSSSEAPVVGQLYRGCLVAAVNGQQATLVSPTEITSWSSSTRIEQQVESALASWPAVDGVSGTWRLPTAAEAKDFLLNSDLLTGTANYYYFVMHDGILQRLTFTYNYAKKSYNVSEPDQTVSNNTRLRPVIDITF